jgi:predicted alpha/beta hydrolase family esterase
MEKRVLIVPGLRGSGPGHWQTQLQATHPGYRRVLQHDWLAPRLAEWTAALDDAIRAEGRDVFVVAHGFGCLATLARLASRSVDVLGVLLVAPRRPDEFNFSVEPLQIPAILVASRTDAWLPFSEAQALAHAVHARFVDAGDAGHIEAEWPGVERLLQKLFAMADARERQLQVALTIAN